MTQYSVARIWQKLPVLAFCLCLAGLIVVRLVLFPDNGIWGTIVIVLFWLVTFAFFLKLLLGLVSGERRAEYTCILVALAAFTVSAALGRETVGSVTFIIFVLSLLALAVLWAGRHRGRPDRAFDHQ